MKYEELKINIFNLINSRKVQFFSTLFIFLLIVISSSIIRTSNIPLLEDVTTGEDIPLALDPHYFLRVAETIIKTGNDLPPFDQFRSPSTNVPWHPEILPKAIVGLYNFAKIFDNRVTLRQTAIISPVIFFIIGMILFFFFSFLLSGKKSVALLSTGFLAFSPSYLYRTMAGFSDHEAIGMIGIFLFFITYLFSLKYFEKSWKNVYLFSIITGLSISFVLATWGGAVTFVLTVMPFAFLLYWFFSKKDSLKSLAFYFLLVLSSIFSPILFGYPLREMLNRILSSYGLLVFFVLLFIFIDFWFSNAFNDFRKISFKKYKTLYAFISTIFLGILGLTIFGKNVFVILQDVLIKLINPFGGSDRLGSTVAENSQPYLVQWIGQSGKFVFFFFVLGVLISGIELVKNMRKKKQKYIFISSWILVFSGILFSRISSTSLFNGVNILSKSFYLISLLIFGIILLKTFMRQKFKAEISTILIFSILFFTLINGRSASRVFFLVAPFVFFSSAYALRKIYDYFLKSNGELSKIILGSLLFLMILVSIFSISGDYNQIKSQAKVTGPSAGIQWQKSMEWVRENTLNGDIFIHWWDYGYWVQTLGKRPTVTDGGHSGGIQADHYIGRYVLTTPDPSSALSYMKTWNVSYLLIDPTDLGKYPAYSRIGGGHEDPKDRLSSIPVMVSNEKQIRETEEGIQIIFQGGSYLFEDIFYETNGTQTFLPGGNAAIIGITVNLKTGNSGQASISQPFAIYFYNNLQTQIPLRYAYYGGQLVDYGNGLDAVAFIIPSFDGQKINPMGSAIYLSQKVSKSLFAQLFLMGDVFKNYPTLKLAHEESDPLIEQLRTYGYSGGEFVYYGGFRGPIKIWEVAYPEETKLLEEFKEPLNGEYARFDGEFY